MTSVALPTAMDTSGFVLARTISWRLDLGKQHSGMQIRRAVNLEVLCKVHQRHGGSAQKGPFGYPSDASSYRPRVNIDCSLAFVFG